MLEGSSVFTGKGNRPKETKKREANRLLQRKLFIEDTTFSPKQAVNRQKCALDKLDLKQPTEVKCSLEECQKWKEKLLKL